MNIVKDKLLGEGWYYDRQEQHRFDDASIEKCHLAALRAWKKLEDAGNSSTLFTKIVEGSWKPSQISCKDWFQL